MYGKTRRKLEDENREDSQLKFYKVKVVPPSLYGREAEAVTNMHFFPE
jgi:hypothetical protein